MKIQSILAFVLLIFTISDSFSQSTNFSTESRGNQILGRLQIKTGCKTPYHNAIKPYARNHSVLYAFDLLENDSILSRKDRYDIQYLLDDSNECLETMDIDFYQKTKKPILKTFYRSPANFYELNQRNIHLRVNPILNFFYANAENQSEPVLLNRAGLRLRGGLYNKVFFASNLWRTQGRFANYVTSQINETEVIPGAESYGAFESSLFNIENGFDFSNAQFYINFNVTKHVGVQLGHGKNFIGNGYRSLLLSDFSSNYNFLKFDWNVWRFQFQNIFAELETNNQLDRNTATVKKYTATHYLDYALHKNINIGFFETVVFSRNNQFEFQYLNPVILYRTVEQAIGSPDNVIIGLNGNWNFLKRFQIYGQLILDEFKFDELILDNRGWWANKYGYQAGIKYINALGVDHLDLQFETNTVRPYTYTHNDTSAVYSHFNQPLAHPLGANFREYLGIMRYRPTNKLSLEVKVIQYQKGEDDLGRNWGGNILLSNDTKAQSYNNTITQGVTNTTTILSGLASYELFHNCFLDLEYFQRSKNSIDDKLDLETRYIGGGFRLNIARLDQNF